MQLRAVSAPPRLDRGQEGVRPLTGRWRLQKNRARRSQNGERRGERRRERWDVAAEHLAWQLAPVACRPDHGLVLEVKDPASWHPATNARPTIARHRTPWYAETLTSKEAARILLRARQALLLGAFVLTAVWARQRQGLFRFFADTQFRLTGGYDASFALLFTFLTLFVAAMAVGAFLTSLIRRRFSKEEWQAVLLDTTALWDGSWWKRR